ncbi:MAG: outer membrane protein assembly factor BamB [Akkermansiaceae bacterium]|jgi:outer membrane protein assembly factor BamB
MKLLVLLLTCVSLSAQIKPLVGTYLGDNQRNFYGNQAPTKLRVKWKTALGTGKTTFGTGDTRTWKGAGWTGQPLVIQEGGELYLIQGTLSHHVKKIRARDGKVIWSTSVGDVIKGTPTFADVGGPAESRYTLIVGSRSGYGQHWRTGTAHSLHGISYITGKKLWRHNSRATASNSRDVDASAVVIGSKAAIPLENGYFTIFSPDARKARMVDGFPAPKISKQFLLYKESDRALYKSELCCESSPTMIGRTAYVAAGVGRVYACGLGFFGGGATPKLDIGGDLNGTMPLTNDKHLLLGIEKQFIAGQGGVVKFSTRGKVKWFHPLPDRKWYTWNGGLVGSPAVNHRYNSTVSKDLACFVGIDGNLTLINHKKLQPGVTNWGPRRRVQYPAPLVLDTVKLPQGSISTPLFVGDKIIVGYDNGMDLYQVTPAGKMVRLDRLSGPMFDATPVVWNGRVYAGSKDGSLYCLGN